MSSWGRGRRAAGQRIYGQQSRENTGRNTRARRASALLAGESIQWASPSLPRTPTLYAAEEREESAPTSTMAQTLGAPRLTRQPVSVAAFALPLQRATHWAFPRPGGGGATEHRACIVPGTLRMPCPPQPRHLHQTSTSALALAIPPSIFQPSAGRVSWPSGDRSVLPVLVWSLRQNIRPGRAGPWTEQR